MYFGATPTIRANLKIPFQVSVCMPLRIGYHRRSKGFIAN